MRRSSLRRVVRLAVFLGLASLVVYTPASWADHTVTVTHQPPPAAVAGTPVVLSGVVQSDCRGLTSGCDNIVVSASYQVGATTKSVSTTTGSSGGTFTLTIPGSDVQAPALTYTLTASQQECAGIGGCTLDCHTASTSETHTVPVT